jgi:nitroreductase
MSDSRSGRARDAILSRRSVRAFLDAPVDRAIVEEILTTAARAPSGTNMQPWRVYVVTGEARRQLTRLVIAKRDAEPERERGPRPFGEYDYNPEPLWEPYLSRRRKIGWDLYKLLNVTKGDRQASWVAAGRNFEFFGAPVGLIFTIDRSLERGSWLDYGIFLQSVMLAARDYALHTCCQAAWRHYHDVIRAVIDIPRDEIVVCGMSLGYADLDAPANRLRSDREPLENFARFVEAPKGQPTSPSSHAEDSHASS